jgi:hypothetical protein
MQEISAIIIFFILGLVVVYRSRRSWYLIIPSSFGEWLRLGLQSVPEPFSKKVTESTKNSICIMLWTVLVSFSTVLLTYILSLIFLSFLTLIPAFFIAMFVAMLLADIFSLTVIGFWFSKSEQ